MVRSIYGPNTSSSVGRLIEDYDTTLISRAGPSGSGRGGGYPGRRTLMTIKLMPTLQDLHYAIRLKDATKVSTLTSYTNINLNSSLRSCTALSLAVYEQSVDIVRILLAAGADPNKLSRDWTDRLETPLFSACRLGNQDIARLLLESGRADVNATDFYNHTSLWIATRERRLDIVKLLIEYGANLNAADTSAQCPLNLATKYLGRSEIAKLLIRHGCALDLTDTEGHGALYWSLVNHQLDVFKMLVFAGAHINRRDRDYLTSKNLSANIKADVEFCSWLDNQLRHPPSLLRSAVRAVRRNLISASGGCSTKHSVKQLPLSQNMQDELMLKDIEF